MKLCDHSLQLDRTCQGSKKGLYELTIDDETITLCETCLITLVQNPDVFTSQLSLRDLTTGQKCDRITITDKDGRLCRTVFFTGD